MTNNYEEVVSIHDAHRVCWHCSRDGAADGRFVGRREDDGGLREEPSPLPAASRTLYREDERFVETYFSKFGRERYLAGDAARKDSDGYFWVIGRIDDVVNVSGHRLSTAEVESAIVAHEKVAEAAVIGQSDEDTGQAICAFVTLSGSTEPTVEADALSHAFVDDLRLLLDDLGSPDRSDLPADGKVCVLASRCRPAGRRPSCSSSS